MRRHYAFTLIELLVTISIIGILIIISGAAWGSVAARSRDNNRKSDLNHLKSVLAQYYTDQKSYPGFDTSALGGRLYDAEWQLGNTGCTHATTSPRLVPNYIASIPSDPQGQNKFTGDCTQKSQQGMYLYLSSTDPNDQVTSAPASSDSARGYVLMAHLENTKDPSILAGSANPLFTNQTGYEYYNTGSSFNNTYSLNQNYLISGSFGH